MSIKRAAIAKFVKARSRGRKVYFFRGEATAKKSVLADAAKAERQTPKPKFEFNYSERYNLKRPPPEEAAAIRKKLEAEGH